MAEAIDKEKTKKRRKTKTAKSLSKVRLVKKAALELASPNADEVFSDEIGIGSERENPILRRGKEGLFIVLFGFALFLLLSLVTYDLDDPSWLYSGSNEKVMNAGGTAGAWIASLLLSFAGYLAFLVPISLIGGAFKVLSTEHKPHSVALTTLKLFGAALFVLASAGLFTLHANDPADYLAGGYLGQWVQKVFLPQFGLLGVTMLLIAAVLAGLTLATGISWFTLMEFLGRNTTAAINFIGLKAKQLYLSVKQLQEQRREQRQQAPAARETEPSLPIRREVLEKNLEKTKATSKDRTAKTSQRPPAEKIKIEPAVDAVTPSNRAQKERQKALFDDPLLGDLPELALLDPADANQSVIPEEVLNTMARLVELKLADFNIQAEVVAVNPGPVITRFELDLAPGIKVSKISNLAKDLARSLSVISVRVVEVIPGKSVIGLEIPNENREMVRLSEVLSSKQFDKSSSMLSMGLGKDISGNPVVVDLAKMPHCLVAGTTGSGKSVGLNAMILSLLYKASPEELRLIMIDPKMLELSVYEGIPHLLCPVVTDMKDAANALRWGVGEMERRYRLMAALGVRNLAGFNRKVREGIKNGEPLKDPLWKNEDDLDESPPLLEELPAIVIVIDELADLMMIVGKKVEELIARIAQKARAAGIHLLLATQRPSVDVLTGLIKANIPTRMAFQVSSRIDSRTILDQAGAEQLLGQGDMLYQPAGTSIPTRIHGAFVDDHEVHKVVSDWKKRGSPDYLDDILEGTVEAGTVIPGETPPKPEGEQDPLYDEAVQIVTESRKASISGVQRRLKIGYNRAARLIEEMESAGVVSAMQSNGTREVIAPPPIKH